MPIPKNLKNTWKIAEEYFERLNDPKENPQLELFESSWKVIEKEIDEYSYMSHRYEALPSKLETKSPLDRFLDDVSEGLYPTPEVISVIAECFSYYFGSEGKVELEDIFFGVTLEKGTGNYSAQRKRHERFSRLSLWEGLEKQGAEKMKRKRNSLISMIENDPVLSGLLHDREDIDSFLRSYRRWKKATGKKLEDLDKEELELYYQRFLR